MFDAPKTILLSSVGMFSLIQLFIPTGKTWLTYGNSHLTCESVVSRVIIENASGFSSLLCRRSVENGQNTDVKNTPAILTLTGCWSRYGNNSWFCSAVWKRCGGRPKNRLTSLRIPVWIHELKDRPPHCLSVDSKLLKKANETYRSQNTLHG